MPNPQSAIEELASFCTIGRPAAGLSPIRNPQSTIRNREIGFVLHNLYRGPPTDYRLPVTAYRLLALFCTIGLGESMEFLFYWWDCRASLYREARKQDVAPLGSGNPAPAFGRDYRP